jgi:hypothetical protein
MFNLGCWKGHFNRRKTVLINGTSKEKHVKIRHVMIPFQLFFIPHNGSSL